MPRQKEIPPIEIPQERLLFLMKMQDAFNISMEEQDDKYKALEDKYRDLPSLGNIKDPFQKELLGVLKKIHLTLNEEGLSRFFSNVWLKIVAPDALKQLNQYYVIYSHVLTQINTALSIWEFSDIETAALNTILWSNLAGMSFQTKVITDGGAHQLFIAHSFKMNRTPVGWDQEKKIAVLNLDHSGMVEGSAAVVTRDFHEKQDKVEEEKQQEMRRKLHELAKKAELKEKFKDMANKLANSEKENSISASSFTL